MKHHLERDTVIGMISDDPVAFTGLSQIAVPIINAFDNPNSSFHDLTEIISKDEALTEKVLRIANSGYYGFRREVKTLSHAAVLLGWNAIKMLALGSTILGRMKDTNEHLFNHSMRTAVIARFVAAECRLYKVEEIAVVGLLHDIGTIILDKYFPETSLKVKQYVIDYSVPTYVAEREILGVDHGIVGGWVLEEWDMPRNITSSVMWHHDYLAKTYHARKTAAIHVADVLALATDVTGPVHEKIPEINKTALKTLGISEPDLRDMVLTIMNLKMDPLIV